MTTVKYDRHAIFKLQFIEYDLLSAETLVPPKSTPVVETDNGSNFTKYHGLLRDVAEKYAMFTPAKFSDPRIEMDYLTWRVKFFHRLDTSTPTRTAADTEEECGRKLALLQKFFTEIKRRANV